MRRRHRYVTVISDGETGRLLAMVPHRSAAALSGFLAEQGHRWCRHVEVVVSDGSVAYQTAINTHLGHSIHVLDRLHVARWFAVGLIQLRRQLQRRPDDQHPPTYDPELFRARFTLLRRVEHLHDGQAVQRTRQFERVRLVPDSRLDPAGELQGVGPQAGDAGHEDLEVPAGLEHERLVRHSRDHVGQCLGREIGVEVRVDEPVGLQVGDRPAVALAECCHAAAL